MKKTIAVMIGSLALIVALAACSTIQSITGGGSSNQQTAANGGNVQGNGRGNNAFGGDPSTMTVEQKLGIGILKLEGTPQALTAEQAKTILPLWQALKTMQTSNNASVDEIDALFTQTKEALTADQVSAIEKLTWTQSDLQALMQQYGMQTFGGQGGAQGTPDATRIAQFRAQGGGNGGNFGGPGGQGGNFGGQGGNGGSTGSATRTPSPQQLNRRAMGMNSIFIDPVIKLLQTKAGTN